MWRRFFDTNPYEGFDPAPYPEDLQGWGSDDPVFGVVIDHLRPGLIVEVGTWKGRSALNMARHCRERGIAAHILCVDTWLGTIESYTRGPEFPPHLRLPLNFRHGWPQVYYQFLANVARAGFQGVITPLPQTSEIAARLLAHLKIVPDLVYLDASHDYEDVRRDLMHYFSLLRPGGILFGDDYLMWEGVTRAVNELAAQTGHVLWGRSSKFVLVKGGDPRSIRGLS